MSDDKYKHKSIRHDIMIKMYTLFSIVVKWVLIYITFSTIVFPSCVFCKIYLTNQDSFNYLSVLFQLKSLNFLKYLMCTEYF